MSIFSKKPKAETARREGNSQRASGKPNGVDASKASVNGPAASAKEMEDSLIKSRRTLLSLGEIVSVLMKSPQYRAASLASIETLVAPALVSGQFLVISAHNKTRGVTAPVAVALWARVSAEVDQRLSEKIDEPIALRMQEWSSGEIPWLLALAGDQRTFGAMLTRLQEGALKGKPLKARLKGEDGKTVVRTITPNSGQPAQVAF